MRGCLVMVVPWHLEGRLADGPSSDQSKMASAGVWGGEVIPPPVTSASKCYGNPFMSEGFLEPLRGDTLVRSSRIWYHCRSSTNYRAVSPIISSDAAPTLNVRQLTGLAFLPLSPLSIDASLLKVSRVASAGVQGWDSLWTGEYLIPILFP